MKALQVEASKGLLSLEELPKPEVSTVTTTIPNLYNYKYFTRSRLT